MRAKGPERRRPAAGHERLRHDHQLVHALTHLRERTLGAIGHCHITRRKPLHRFAHANDLARCFDARDGRRPLRGAAARTELTDALDLLAAWGADLLPFSPLEDRALPAGAGLVLLGGGFPEVFARELAAKVRMRDADQGLSKSGQLILSHGVPSVPSS